MRILFLLLLPFFLLNGCGDDASDDEFANPEGSKWSNQVFQENREKCAKRGNTAYTYNQWYQYCGCMYSDVAVKVNYDGFYSDVDVYVDTMKRNNTFHRCQNHAGMTQVDVNTNWVDVWVGQGYVDVQVGDGNVDVNVQY